jgi:anti-sigma-K factor RskA
MNREHLEELAALDAIGFADAAERETLRNHLRAHPRDRAVVSQFAATSVALSMIADQVAPPPQLKDRVLASLPERRPSTPRRTVEPISEAMPRSEKVVPINWMPWALAACLAVVCGLLVQNNLQLRGDVIALEKQGAVDSLQIAVMSSMLQGAPDARAVCVWNDERQEGLLAVENLPALAADQDYQLWVIDPKYPIPVDGGVFNTTSEGSVRFTFQPGLPVEQANVFAVSLERKGGVPKAEGPMVLISASR